jgi:hypothetical protein
MNVQGPMSKIPRGRNQEGKSMSLGEKLYLGLVILSFLSFALVLASQSHRDGQARKR